MKRSPLKRTKGMMKVYVLETGCYDSRGLHGVYATPELAMSDWLPKQRGSVRGRAYGKWAGKPWEYEWEKDGDGRFSFLADFNDYATITEYEVVEAHPDQANEGSAATVEEDGRVLSQRAGA